jgi:two-component system, cell cycle sensor histidine kinase and response regulator CckA
MQAGTNPPFDPQDKRLKPLSEERAQQRERVDSLGVLVGGIAHDFNNVLASIMGFADLALLDLPEDSPAKGSVDQILAAARDATNLTRQMLAYAGRSRMAIERVNLAKLVDDTIAELAPTLPAAVRLQSRLDRSVPPLEGDSQQLQHLVIGLVGNAAPAFGASGGTIRVVLSSRYCDRSHLASTYLDDGLPEGIYASLEVIDTAPGIGAAARAHLFDPFFTLKRAERAVSLAAVLGIVRSHRGAIDVESEPRGTTFRILLPVKPDEGV